MRIFKEEQRFNQVWIIVLLAVSTLVPLAAIVSDYQKNPDSFTLPNLLLILAIILIAPTLIFTIKLSTRIDEKGIYYKFFPFHLKYKQIPWEDIESAHLRTYDAISEYGGWGLKGGFFWRKSKGTAINVSGDKGLQLELKNGKKLLIGTQRTNEIQQILDTYKSKLEKRSYENN
jgi:hypothetical protein